MASNPRKIDITGQRFGRWTVIEQSGNQKKGGTLWRCTCECGSERIVIGSDLRHGKSVSCGCLRAEKTGERSRTHGETGTRLYQVWQNMHARCGRPSADSYHRYGGRGISVCQEWASFERFRDWARDSGYSDDLTIERVNGDLGYDPDNCIWADRVTQANNRNIVLKLPDGRIAHRVAKENGIPANTFRVRIHAGWTIERAATQPYGQKPKRPRGADGKFVPA